MRNPYQTLKTSHLAQVFAVLATGVAIGSAGVAVLSDPYPPLSGAGQQMKQEILGRLTHRGVSLDRAAHCAAHYIAHQQSERGVIREAFRQQSATVGIPEAETDRIIDLDEEKDMAYALYVFMACRSGQRPAVFDPAVF